MTPGARTLLAVAAVAGFSPMAVFGHEEFVIFGKVESISSDAIVVSERPGTAPRTVSLVPDTEILACKRVKNLNGVAPGTAVRVKYSDTGRRPAAARAIFVMRNKSAAY